MEKKTSHSNPQESMGWEIVKQLNEGLTVTGYNTLPIISSINARKMLADYFRLNVTKPSKLHSAILSCATKMALFFPDFRYVPFLEMWGLQNLRPEDSEVKVTNDGKRFHSLSERMAVAYAYSLAFRPDEHLSQREEQLLKPVLLQKGYGITEKDGKLAITVAVGYVEHIDTVHRHIHIYDNESRHFVHSYANGTNANGIAGVGAYVRFMPVIPHDSSFKSAVILSVLEDGAEAFGYRNATVTYSNQEQGYCAWELLPDADGKVMPIVETGTSEQQEPCTKGYINKTLCDSLNRPMPKKGDNLQIVTFLKRGRDMKKRPVVVFYR